MDWLCLSFPEVALLCGCFPFFPYLRRFLYNAWSALCNQFDLDFTGGAWVKGHVVDVALFCWWTYNDIHFCCGWDHSLLPPHNYVDVSCWREYGNVVLA